MQEKDVKNLTEEQEAEKVKNACRSFEEVWPEIEPRMNAIEVAQKKKRKKIIASIASLAACLVISCSISIPIVLNNQQGELVYYYDNLTKSNGTAQQFLTGIESSNVDFVNFNRFDSYDILLYTTDSGEFKGGKVAFMHTVNASSYMLTLEFASTDVVLDEKDEYAQTCNANGVDVQYNLISAEGGIYVYKTFATYKDVNYLCEIMTDNQDLTIFFNDFFAE